MTGTIRPRSERGKKAGEKPSKAACTKWQLVIEGERGPDGKRKQIYRQVAGTRKDAERKLREFILECENGLVGGGDSDKLTVAAFVEKWLEHTATRVRPKTIARYRQLLETFVVKRSGSKKLREFRAIHVQEIYDVALRTGNSKVKGGGPLSALTVIHLHRILFGAMKQARKWGLIVANPCENVEPPIAEHREMRSLNGDEARRLIAASQGTRLHTVIVLTIAVGFRRGEVLALSWNAIDFEQGTARVSRSLQDDGLFSEPKTARSRRIVALPSFAIVALRAHKAAQNQERLAAGAAYVDSGLVFADPLGGAWKPASISTLFHAICTRAGLGHVRFHDLRHSAASLLIERGVPVTTIAAMLGHANTSTTLSVYAHAIKGAEQVAAQAMDGILKGIESTA